MECKRGHDSGRNRFGQCFECNRISARAYQRRKKQKDPATVRLWNYRAHLKRAYGISVEEVQAMLAAQGGCCAICRSDEPNSKKGWCVDHCHVTKRVRGVLCRGCNLVVGLAKDNVGILVNAANYLFEKGGLPGHPPLARAVIQADASTEVYIVEPPPCR